jgi:hypothetical protein
VLVQIFHIEAYGDRQSVPDLVKEYEVPYSQLNPASAGNFRVGSGAVGADSGGEYSLETGKNLDALLRFGELPKYLVEED